MKGIILAGGSGTRLFPLTSFISKQLLPVYDKPMIYYPLSILLLAGIKEVLIITTPESNGMFIKTLGDGSQWGIKIIYKIQMKPNGIPEAFIIGKDFIKDDRVCFILGDNLFYGESFINKHLLPNFKRNDAVIFGHNVSDPKRYGVVDFDNEFNIKSLEEKPKKPKSNYAISGIYIFDKNVYEIAKNLKPSDRGETEIIDILNHYLKNDNLKLEVLNRGVSWFDTGTHKSLLEASVFVEVLESRQGLKIACIEEICFQKGYINRSDLINLAKPMKNSSYGEYLLKIANSK